MLLFPTSANALLDCSTCDTCGYSLNGLPPIGICPECGNRFDTRVLSVDGLGPPLGMGDRFAMRWGAVLLVVSIYGMVLIESPKDAVQAEFVILCSLGLIGGVLWAKFAPAFQRPRLRLLVSERGLVLSRLGEPGRLIAQPPRSYRWGEMNQPRLTYWRGQYRIRITRKLGFDERLIDIVIDPAHAQPFCANLARYTPYRSPDGWIAKSTPSMLDRPGDTAEALSSETLPGG